MKIIIDPGHGGKDKGGGSNSYFLEKDINLKISLYQYTILKKAGIDVEITRNSDIYLNPEKRTNIVKKSNANICISNHINSFSNNSVKGAEIIHSIYNNGKLARLIMKELVEKGAINRRIFTKKHSSMQNKDYYYMNRNTGNVMTLIVEYGFASNNEDTIKILNNWKSYAEGVVIGILKYLGKDMENISDKKDYKILYEKVIIENNNMKEKLLKIKNMI